MARSAWKKWLFIAFTAILLALILSIGLLVRLQSVSAVKQLVNELSEGKYGFNASKIRVDPLSMTVRAWDVHIHPVHAGASNNEFELQAASVRFNLNDIIGLLLTRTLHVENFTIERPSLELRVYEKDSTKVKTTLPLHIQVSRIQTVFFEVLNSLQVKHCFLRDGSIAYYPERSQNRDRYFLNHITLNIQDLHLLKKIDRWNKDNKVMLQFELNKPQIEYPDTTIRVSLEKLFWDTRKHRFEMNGLALHKSFVSSEDSSGFRLDDIELDSINWNRLLTEGRVELGELKASKGFFSSNEFRLKKNKDSVRLRTQGNLLDVIGPILIRRLNIREIEFNGFTHTRRGKENIHVIGDHFLVTDLLIDKTLPNKVSLDELQLKVRAYAESDSSRTFQAGFGEMTINRNNLILKDYFLHTPAGSRYGQNKIDVKQLILIELSVPDLINGKLKAKELVLSDPRVDLRLSPARKKRDQFPWLKLQRDIRKKLDIGQLEIRNATVVVHRPGYKEPLVNTDSFYAVISSRNLLRSRTLEELFRGESSLKMPRLVLRFDNMRIDCKNAIYDRRTFYAESARGKSADGNLRFDFNHMLAHDVNTAGILTRKDSAWLRSLIIGNGEIYFRIPDTKSRKPELPTDLVRTIRSGRLNLQLETQDWSIVSELDSLSIDSLRYVDNDWKWDSLYVSGRSLSLKHPRVNGSTGAFAIGYQQPNYIRKLDIVINNPGMNVSLKIPRLQFSHSITHSIRIMDGLKQVTLHQPIIDIALKTVAPDEKAAAVSGKQVRIPAITMEDPYIRLRRDDDGDIKELASVQGGKVNLEPLLIKDGIVETGGVDISFKQFSSHQEKFDLVLPQVSIKTGQISFQKEAPIKTVLHRFAITGGSFNYQKNGMLLALTGINTELQKSQYINSSKDSLKKLVTSLPHLRMEIGHLMYEKHSRTLAAEKLKVEADKKRISFDSLSWISNISRDSFFAAKKYQTDFIQMRTGPGAAMGYRMSDLGVDSIWHVEAFALSAMDLLVERDKRKPMDTISYRPMLTGILMNLPFKFTLDRIDLTNSRIRYNEISDKTGKEGSIWFTDMDATVRNIRNMGLSEKDSLRITARTKLMNEGDLRFSFRQSYIDSLQGFFMGARMSGMDLNALSPLLYPLFNLRIDKGAVDSLWLQVKANDYLAFGQMALNYRNLHLSLLSDNGRKKGMTSFLLNSLLRNRNKKSGIVYRERLRNKSIFNYWGKIALSGLLTNMGVQRDKKALKKYQKEMLSLDLPANLLSE